MPEMNEVCGNRFYVKFSCIFDEGHDDCYVSRELLPSDRLYAQGLLSPIFISFLGEKGG